MKLIKFPSNLGGSFTAKVLEENDKELKVMIINKGFHNWKITIDKSLPKRYTVVK